MLKKSPRNLLFFLVLILFSALASPIRAEDRALSLILARAQAKNTVSLSAQGWGVYVAPLNDRANLLLTHQADQLLNPASLMKLLTTAVALEQLGAAHTFKTSIWKKNNTLYFKGGGDPYLTLEQFWLLLRELRARGEENLQGPIVLDRSGYPLITDDPAAFDNDPQRAYNAPPNPLLLNFHSLSLRFIPDLSNNTVRVTSLPLLDGLQITPPLLSKNSKPCANWRDALKMSLPPSVATQSATAQSATAQSATAQIAATRTKNLISFAGSYNANCGEQTLNLYPYFLTPNDYFAGLFRTLWRELGGSWQGDIKDGIVPFDATLLIEHDSQSLINIIRAINKFSNNVMARQLFLNLSTTMNASPSTDASLLKSAEKIDRWFDSHHLPRAGIVPDNGAGLSRSARISPAQLGGLLRWVFQSPMMPDFVSSLPRIGVDGSMKSRLKNDTVNGRAYLKTGRLNDVSGIAGYVQSARGQWYVVVSMLNQAGAESKTGLHDSLVQWVYEQ